MRVETDEEYRKRIEELRKRPVIGNRALRTAVKQLVAGKKPHIGRNQGYKACGKLCGDEACIRNGCRKVVKNG